MSVFVNSDMNVGCDGGRLAVREKVRCQVSVRSGGHCVRHRKFFFFLLC